MNDVTVSASRLPTAKLFLFVLAIAAFSPCAALASNFAGVNFSGDSNLTVQQKLAPTDAAGLFAQKFWSDAPGLSGQVGIEIDGGTSIPVLFSGFTAHWQAGQVGSAPSGSVLPNGRLMRGSLLASSAAPALVQFSGIPLVFTSGGYALVVYCDVPGNAVDVVIKATVETSGTVRTLYLRDPAARDFSGSFARAALTSSEDTGQNTPAGNLFIFRGLTSADLAVLVEPGESNPGALAAINAVQLIPSSLVQSLAPRITSRLQVAAVSGEAFSYSIQTDVPATGFEASGLPSGLILDRTSGVISGTPGQTGAFSVLLKAANAAGATTETLQLTLSGSEVTDLSLYMVPALLVRGQVGKTYLIEYADAVENPTQWKSSSAITLTNQSQFYVDLSATNRVKRFYRATIQP